MRAAVLLAAAGASPSSALDEAVSRAHGGLSPALAAPAE